MKSTSDRRTGGTGETTNRDANRQQEAVGADQITAKELSPAQIKALKLREATFFYRGP